MFGRNNMICFGMYACRVCDALVASCATDQATPLFMNQNGRPTINEVMAQLIYTGSVATAAHRSVVWSGSAKTRRQAGQRTARHLTPDDY